MKNKDIEEFPNIAKFVTEVASDKLASDIVMLDMREMQSFTDYFIIVTVDSQRQMNTLVDEFSLSLKGKNRFAHHVEGSSNSGWVLMDYGDFVIHLFGQEERTYYDLEEIWHKANVAFRIQ
jgi:ribosome-associated protein